MTEKKYRDRIIKKLRVGVPYLKTLRHEDMFSSGIPDISITRAQISGASRVLWLEAKWRPTAKFGKLQQKVLKELGGFYLVGDYGGITLILTPDMLTVEDCLTDFGLIDWVVNQLDMI